MKIFKLVDMIVQLITIILGVVFGLIYMQYAHYSYFIVGGWQVLSCLIHGLFPQYYNKVKDRRRYLITLLVLIILTCLIFFGTYFEFDLLLRAIIPFGFILFVITPIMAIWYCYICYTELKLYQQKEWIQLR
jgi:hypothetical protein